MQVLKIRLKSRGALISKRICMGNEVGKRCFTSTVIISMQMHLCDLSDCQNVIVWAVAEG